MNRLSEDYVTNIVQGLPAFPSLDHMWKYALALTFEGNRLDSRNGGSLEVLGSAMRLEDIRANFILNPMRKASPVYACAELLWYLSMTDDPTMLLAYAPSYVNYLNDGKAFGSYGHRWKKDPGFQLRSLISAEAYTSQIDAVLALLTRTPNTRQAIVIQWNGADLVHAIHGDKKDLPCTLSLAFNVRDNKLYLDVTMRSNDLWKGFPYDVFCFTTLQRIIADALGLEYGYYTHHVVSLHLYDKNIEKAKLALLLEKPAIKVSNTYSRLLNSQGLLWNKVEKALHFEKCVRTRKTQPEVNSEFVELLGDSKMDPIADAAIVCASKWDSRLVSCVISPLLSEGLKGLGV